MKIIHLYEKPEMVTAIAEYGYREWGHKRPDNSLEKAIKRITERIYNKPPPNNFSCSRE